MRTFLATVTLCCCFAVPLGAAPPPPGKRPNVIVVLTDDQGYGDFSCHGNPVLKTPHLDRLAAGAARFTDFHVSPTCSPTRAAIMTGRHEFKNGVTHTIHERERLALSAVTLPQVLKSAGYQTGIFGKWHLGDETPYRPDRRGFDEVFTHGCGGIGQHYPGSCSDAPGNGYFDPLVYHKGKLVKTEGYCTDVFFGQARRWVAEHAKSGQPFFCYVATNAPHAPLHARPEDEARYRDLVRPEVAKFFGMVANIDDNVGRLAADLKTLGIERDTLVVMMTDNGGTVGVPVHNAGLRGAKVTPWLGGTQAASLWSWPGTITPGDRGQLTAHLDVMPTLLDLAGVPPDAQPAAQIEGRSLVPLLRDPDAEWPERTLFTHVGRWPPGADPDQFQTAKCSVRTPRWHLVNLEAGPPKWQLYDVAAERGEKTNVADRHPEVVKRLVAEQDEWWRSLKGSLVNERSNPPEVAPFVELYRQQFPRPMPKP